MLNCLLRMHRRIILKTNKFNLIFSIVFVTETLDPGTIEFAAENFTIFLSFGMHLNITPFSD